ncbi:hypothetical protein A0H81_00575 [Grifola frondosa]|uniref:Uncharacterized protein n=1 Tax=Grifola frondosa TaxID=5627 RepID=A0A1C7MR51_GRIFR|nr:hypothetical protein A0H81_00575 [Grifola frondosa]
MEREEMARYDRAMAIALSEGRDPPPRPTRPVRPAASGSSPPPYSADSDEYDSDRDYFPLHFEYEEEEEIEVGPPQLPATCTAVVTILMAQ